VLLFPHGEAGWTHTLRYLDQRRKLTLMDFCAYRLHPRQDDHYLHTAGRLFHCYAVDCYARLEQERLNWVRHNQKTIRSELYQGLQDAVVAGGETAATVGQRVVLPSSFTGGPRFMNQLFQDAMAIVRDKGSPDLFITVTCNPKWPDITDALLPGQTANDRPDICARVFELKLKDIKADIFNRHVFGRVIGHIHVIEFQKRGLPHAHILVILHPEDKPRSPDDYDEIVSAELPELNEENRRLYDTVTASMIHGPCGTLNPNSPCMVDGVCSKNYPKDFAAVTKDDADGYPTYRRRENGQTVTVRRQNNVEYEVDNRWVVPHSKYLCIKYNAHINVEICTSITAVKYLYKYVYKGHDRIMVEMQAAPNQPAAQLPPNQQVAQVGD